MSIAPDLCPSDLYSVSISRLRRIFVLLVVLRILLDLPPGNGGNDFEDRRAADDEYEKSKHVGTHWSLVFVRLRYRLKCDASDFRSES